MLNKLISCASTNPRFLHAMTNHSHLAPIAETWQRARSLALLATCLLFAITTVAPQARASLMVSNLGVTPNGLAAVNDFAAGPNRSGFDTANSFTTGAAATTLQSVTLSLFGGSG